GGTVTADVVVTVNGADDNPVAAPDSNGVAKHSSLLASTANGVLANDTDPDVPDQGHLTVGAVHGAPAHVRPPVARKAGSLTPNADGSYLYVSDKGGLPSHFVAQDTFDYTVDDGHGGTDTSTLSIVVFNPGTSYISGANTTLNGGNGPDVVDGSFGHDH